MPVNAHSQFVACEQLLIDTQHIGRGGHILYARHAVFSGIAHRGFDGFGDFCGAWIGNDFVHRIHRGVFQHAGRLARFVAHDQAAGRIRRGFRDACEFERDRICQSHVTVEPLHKHRMVQRDGINQLARRQLRG